MKSRALARHSQQETHAVHTVGYVHETYSTGWNTSREAPGLPPDITIRKLKRYAKKFKMQTRPSEFSVAQAEGGDSVLTGVCDYTLQESQATVGHDSFRCWRGRISISGRIMCLFWRRSYCLSALSSIRDKSADCLFLPRLMPVQGVRDHLSFKTRPCSFNVDCLRPVFYIFSVPKLISEVHG